jgi:cell division protein FtsW (lipid II flippase)
MHFQRTLRREAMITLIIYAGIFMLSIYIAVVSQGYIMALALVVGGIAFFAIQRHLHKYYSEIVTKDGMDSDSDDDHLRLPPA